MLYGKVEMLNWNVDFLSIFLKRDELPTTPDDILCVNDRVVIPSSLRKSVFEDFHIRHVGGQS